MKQKKAFSLVELSIIIVVMSMLLIGYLAWTTVPSIDDGLKYQETRRKMKVIHKAIENFIAQNKRLPCAAYFTYPNDNFYSYPVSGFTPYIGFDDEMMFFVFNAGGGQYGTNCANNSGNLPVRTLGLPSDFQIDGWGRRFIYTASKTNPMQYRNSAFTYKAIKISTAGATLASDVIYTLYSAGSNGYYAYLTSGQPMPASSDTDEATNGAFGASFIQKPMVAGAYDDIVEFRTKEQIDNASTTASPATLISQADCAANSAAIASLDTATMTSLATNITITRRCITTTCGSGTYGVDYDNAGDEAAFGILWAVQDACYELYGAANTLTRSCTSPWTSYATSNACCPTKFGQVAGRAVNCGGAKYLTDINACTVTTYAQGVDCWIGN